MWICLIASLFAWLGIYFNLAALTEAVFSLLPVQRDTHFGDAVHFFIFDTPKAILLLTLIVFAMGVVACGILLAGYVFNAVF